MSAGLDEQITQAEKSLEEAKKRLAELTHRKKLRAIEDCVEHDFRYTGTGRHGSDKGDVYEECRKCGAKTTNGSLDKYQ